MLEPQERKQYSRQIILPEIGMEGQEKLKNARVLIIGAGGLGCPVLQYLAAAGVGNIGIVDDDAVDVTNLHRQILYNARDVGKSKAVVAAEKLSVLNPFVNITAFQVRLNETNAAELISQYDFVIDGSDNFPTRYIVNDACVALDKPMVFGSILRFEGQVSVFNYQNGPTYRCLFPDAEEGDNCEVAGVLSVLPGIAGTYMANEAIKIICQVGEVLSGKLLVFNALTNDLSVFRFSRSAAIATTPVIEKQAKVAHAEIREISWEEFEALQQIDEVELIDVREYYEYEADNFGGTNIPLSDIPENISTLATAKRIVFYCQSGKRSNQAAKLMLSNGYKGDLFSGFGW